MAKRSKKKKFTANFDDVGKSFRDGQEYLIKVTECTVEEGENAPYYSFKFEGTEDYEGSVMYHNASLSPTALWKTRDLFEAFLGEVPSGDFEPEDYTDEFVGKMAMCSVYKDSYNGNTRIKPEDFWAAEGVETGDSGDEEIDLGDLDDDDIMKIAKALKIKSKRASTVRKKLEDADPDELYEAMQELGLVDGDEKGEDEGDGIDLDELDDDDIKALAKAAGIKGRAVKKLKAALEELDDDELADAAEEAGIGGDSGSEGEVDADAIKEMSQDELEELVEEHELDVDLDDYKTLRKKRTAVVDAAEEAGILAE